ncbi:MAG: hypothetical protein WC780_04980 [Lentimicrobiaceae bacterium]
MKTIGIAIFFILLLTTSCEVFEHRYNTGTFPDEPVNMGDINSEFDDYNSTSPIIGSSFPLCFSSTRNSQGADYDIVYKFVDVFMDRKSGKLTVAEDIGGPWRSAGAEYANIYNAISHINTSYNEFGPYLILDSRNDYRTNPLFILLYSNDQGGNQDIRYVHNLDAYNLYTYPQPVTWLNSPKDDAYPTLTPDSLTMYFCSDRDVNFDIYKVQLDGTKSLRKNLEDTASKTITKENVLSSAGNDKCPFIMDSLMVFASDRAGGFGGFDLYYSRLLNGKWSAPVNFGEKINTKYDEYRPIVKPFWDFTNDFMIFSSNRPGGKGGFDLYYVGVDKILKK